MPEIIVPSGSATIVKLWKIDEDESFFLQNAPFSFQENEELSEIKHPAKRLEWLASRFLLKKVCNTGLLSKNQHGKIVAKDNSFHVSISHCKGFACVAYSNQKPVGIDIEPINEKIHRIAVRFMNEQELNFIDSNQQTEHLVACWSIKEAIFKMAGEDGVEFSSQITISPFDVNFEQPAAVKLTKENRSYVTKVRIIPIENCILVYTF